MNKLSIVIPVYYNEQNLRPLYEDLKNKLIDAADFEYELVMVDDGSGLGGDLRAGKTGCAYQGNPSLPEFWQPCGLPLRPVPFDRGLCGG